MVHLLLDYTEHKLTPSETWPSGDQELLGDSSGTSFTILAIYSYHS